MNKLLLTAVLTASALPAVMAPTAAVAQSRAEVRDSYRDLQEERHDLRQAQRYGDRRDVREERRDVRQAEREYSKDLRDYRRSHRDVYRRGEWRAPFAYRSWQNGAYIDRSYYGSRYYLDGNRYRLPPVGRSLRYVRHYDDVLLVDTRSGRVVRVYRNFFW